MGIGLQQEELAEIIRVLQDFPGIEEALIFGSRAKGSYKKGSDIDIAVKGSGINHEVVAALSFQLNEETTLPYFFDIIHYEEISEQELLAHIDRVGKYIYLRNGVP